MRYHIRATRAELASDEELGKWAHDPNCIEMEVCAEVLAKRLVKREAAHRKEVQRLSERGKFLQDNPFDPRTEISADALHIASRIGGHLWMIFVLLPFVIVLLWAVVEVI
jgi:hypothetical protein